MHKNSIAIIRNGKIIYVDDSSPVIRPSETANRESRESQKTRYRKDLLQRNQVDYYKAYPEKAKDLNPELRRLLS